MVNNRTNTTLTLSRERGTGVTVNGLLPDCVYHVRVRAGSAEGSGPWSTDFTAQTLSTGIQSSLPGGLSFYLSRLIVRHRDY